MTCDDKKKGYMVLIAFNIISTAISIILGFKLWYYPHFDLGALFEGGLVWAQSGDFQSYKTYFATWPHNIPALFLFKCIFTVYNIFGMNAYHYHVMVIFTVLSLQVSVFAIYDSVRRLMGVRAGIMALIIIAIYLPFYTMGAAFYTDVLSLPFIALSFNFYLRVKDAECIKHKFIYAVAFGVFIGVGTLIKATVIIVLIACLIDWIVNIRIWKFADIKKNVQIFGATTLAVAFIMIPFNLYFNSLVPDDLLYKHRVPLLHTVLQGLTEEHGGVFNTETRMLYNGLENVDVRTAEIKRLINNRVEEMGFTGLVRLAGVKLGMAFQSGTFDQAWHIGVLNILWLYGVTEEPVQSTILHETLLPTGKYYSIYNHISTALMLGMLIFAIASAFIRILIRSFTQSDYQICAPWVAFIGLTFFLMIFETGNRFPMGFFPLLVICAVHGFYDIRMLWTIRNSKKCKSYILQ